MSSHNQINLKLIESKDFNGLLEANKRYIASVANSMGANNEDELKDLICAGNIGLWKAYLGYDKNRSPIFMSYAKVLIKYEMMDYLTKYGRTVYLPAHQIKSDRQNDTNSSLSLSLTSDGNGEYMQLIETLPIKYISIFRF